VTIDPPSHVKLRVNAVTPIVFKVRGRQIGDDPGAAAAEVGLVDSYGVERADIHLAPDVMLRLDALARATNVIVLWRADGRPA
jgi:hypothetical protein